MVRSTIGQTERGPPSGSKLSVLPVFGGSMPRLWNRPPHHRTPWIWWSTHLLDELAGMFGKLPDRLNAAAKRPFECAVTQIVRVFDPQSLALFQVWARSCEHA